MTSYDEKVILGIDTSTRKLKLGVRFGGDRLIKAEEEIEQSHSRLMIKKTDELFQSAGVGKESLDAIVVCTGPGSFTGLRIGLAAAKGIAVAYDIPVVGVDLFEIAAYRLREHTEPIRVIVPLKRDEFFVTRVQDGRYSREDIEVVRAEDLTNSVDSDVVAAYGIDLPERFAGLKDRDLSQRIQYDATELIYLGTNKLNEGSVDDLAELEPLYLMKSQAEINFERRNKK